MDYSEITGLEYFKSTGKFCSPAKAVKFMVDLFDRLPDDMKTPKFCEDYPR